MFNKGANPIKTPFIKAFLLSLSLSGASSALGREAQYRFGAPVETQTPPSVTQTTTAKNQNPKAFLQSRFSEPQVELGPFRTFASGLLSNQQVLVGTTDDEVMNSSITRVHARDYNATYGELFESVARQTKSRLHFEPEGKIWRFNPPEMAHPFALAVPAGWKVKDRGIHVDYLPPDSDTGLSVFILGRYSGVSQPEMIRYQREIALVLAGTVSSESKSDEMTAIELDGTTALYWETPGPMENKYWRQWVLIKDNQAFALVLNLDTANEKQFLSIANKMLLSFHVQAQAPESLGLTNE